MSRQPTARWWRRPAAILTVYILLTIGLTWPLLPNLARTVPNDIGDPLLNTWILAWDAHALLTDPLNLFNANIFHPLPNTLAFSEHLFSTALLALPLQLASAEPVVAYNLSLLLSFPLAAFGMYLLALHWTGQRSAAFIAGLIFGFAPYRFAAIAHLQLLTFQWLPFALLFLEKAGRWQGAGSRRAGSRGAEEQGSKGLQGSREQGLTGSKGAEEQGRRGAGDISVNTGKMLRRKSPPGPPKGGEERAIPPTGGLGGPTSGTPRRWREYGLFGFFLLLQLLASWYLALYTALILSVFLLSHILSIYQTRQTKPTTELKNPSLFTLHSSLKPQTSKSFTHYASRITHQASRFTPILNITLTLAIVIALTLPFALPYVRLLDELRAARPLSLALSLAAQPTDYLAAAPFNQLFGPLTAPFRDRSGFTEENVLFVGIVAPILAAIGVIGYGALGRWGAGVQGRRGAREQGRWGAGEQDTGSKKQDAKSKDAENLNPKRDSQNPKPRTQNSKLSAKPPRGKTQNLPHASRFPSTPLRTGTFHVSRFTPHLPLLTLLLISLLLTFPTPYALLAELVPPTTLVRVPPRWIIPGLFALAGLAACGVSVINEKLRIAHYELRIANCALRITHYSLLITHYSLVFLLLAETFSAPLPLAAVENRATLNPAYRWLAGQPGSDQLALVELPLHSAPAPEFPEVKRLYASTLGWWQLVNGYSGYTPSRQPELAAALAGFPDAHAIETLQRLSITNCELRIAEGCELSNNSKLSAKPPRGKTQNSKFFLLVHPGEAPLDRTQWETVDRWRAERSPALHPIGQFEGDYLYRVRPPAATNFADPPLATFGPDRTILLKGHTIDPSQSTIRNSAPHQSPEIHHSSLITHHSSIAFFWQPTTPLPTDYTVFIHLRAVDGFVRSQADGPPVSGHHPTSRWQPGEIIQDIHTLPPAEDYTQVDHLAIGLYNPNTGQRLPAFDPSGQRLPDDALLVPLR